MKTKIFIYLCVLISGMMLYSCGSDDVKLKKKIESKIEKEYPDIAVTVLNGVVTLTGTVNSEEDKTKIEEIAKDEKYIQSVANKIYVDTPQPVVVEKTPDKVFSEVITQTLNSGGFTTVTATVADSVVSLTGDVKKADVKKIVQTVNDLKPKKVDNQLKAN